MPDNCYVFEVIPLDGYGCSDCGEPDGLCEGMSVVIEPHVVWRDALPDEPGYRHNPEKEMPLRSEMECDEDWDGSKLTACSAGAGVCIVSCGSGQWVVCVLCLIAEGATCGDEGFDVCSFVDDCQPSDDPDDFYLEDITVVDFSQDLGASCTG